MDTFEKQAQIQVIAQKDFSYNAWCRIFEHRLRIYGVSFGKLNRQQRDCTQGAVPLCFPISPNAWQPPCAGTEGPAPEKNISGFGLQKGVGCVMIARESILPHRERSQNNYERKSSG